MATFTIPAVAITANVLMVSPSASVVGNATRAAIQLTDPNSLWPATPDPTRHIIRWGLQQSLDGVLWDWGPVYQADVGGLPFGARDRSGGMPALLVERSDIPANVQLRLAILTDADITLGATLTVT